MLLLVDASIAAFYSDGEYGMGPGTVLIHIGWTYWAWNSKEKRIQEIKLGNYEAVK